MGNLNRFIYIFIIYILYPDTPYKVCQKPNYISQLCMAKQNAHHLYALPRWLQVWPVAVCRTKELVASGQVVKQDAQVQFDRHGEIFFFLKHLNKLDWKLFIVLENSRSEDPPNGPLIPHFNALDYYLLQLFT